MVAGGAGATSTGGTASRDYVGMAAGRSMSDGMLGLPPTGAPTRSATASALTRVTSTDINLMLHEQHMGMNSMRCSSAPSSMMTVSGAGPSQQQADQQAPLCQGPRSAPTMVSAKPAQPSTRPGGLLLSLHGTAPSMESAGSLANDGSMSQRSSGMLHAMSGGTADTARQDLDAAACMAGGQGSGLYRQQTSSASLSNRSGSMLHHAMSAGYAAGTSSEMNWAPARTSGNSKGGMLRSDVSASACDSLDHATAGTATNSSAAQRSTGLRRSFSAGNMAADNLGASMSAPTVDGPCMPISAEAAVGAAMASLGMKHRRPQSADCVPTAGSGADASAAAASVPPSSFVPLQQQHQQQQKQGRVFQWGAHHQQPSEAPSDAELLPTGYKPPFLKRSLILSSLLEHLPASAGGKHSTTASPDLGATKPDSCHLSPSKVAKGGSQTPFWHHAFMCVDVFSDGVWQHLSAWQAC